MDTDLLKGNWIVLHVSICQTKGLHFKIGSSIYYLLKYHENLKSNKSQFRKKIRSFFIPLDKQNRVFLAELPTERLYPFSDDAGSRADMLNKYNPQWRKVLSRKIAETIFISEFISKYLIIIFKEFGKKGKDDSFSNRKPRKWKVLSLSGRRIFLVTWKSHFINIFCR